MLPSTGHFKELNCPFYDSGLCERPYCHFRHVKKDPKTSTDSLEHGTILQQLVSEAVKKALQQSDSSTISTPTVTSGTKLTYNPTPISELNKIHGSETNEDESEIRPHRHIPVPYTPHRPTTAPVKRVIDNNEPSKPFIYNPPSNTYSPGSGDSKQPDPYLPQGGTSNGIYKPGTDVQLQTYEPLKPASVSSTGEKKSYIPSGLSDKPVSKKKLIEYEPTRASVNAGMEKYMEKKESSERQHSKEKISGLKYQPTPLHKTLCFSSDEDEPEIKKSKKEQDLNGLNLDLEFEMLGEILDDEQSTDTIKSDEKSKLSKSKDTSNDKHLTKQKDRNSSRDEKVSKNKEKNSKEITKSNSSSSSTKSLKSSHKDKHKDRERHKSKSSDKNSITSSKASSSSSKHTSRSSEKSSNSSSSSRKHDSSKSSRSHKKESSKSESNHKKENKSSRERDKNKSNRERDKKRSNREDDKTRSNKEKIKSDSLNGNSDTEVFPEDVDELIEELSDPDEDTIAMECMKIFEEYVPTPKPVLDEKIEEKQVEEYIPGKKRISHTTDKDVKIIERPQLKPNYKISAAQRMAERISKVREYHTLKNICVNSNDSNMVTSKCETSSIGVSNSLKTDPSPPVTSKVRIAHVPNAMLYSKKPQSAISASEKNEPSTSTTVQTVPKGSARTAHVPNDKFCDRPGVLEPLASKIPANLRSTFLNKIIDECIKIYVTPTDAYARAQQEELTTSRKCNTIPIYKNSAMLTVNRLRKEFQDCRGIKKTFFDIESNKMSHNQVLLGKLTQTSWSIEKTKKSNDFSEEFKGLKFYKNISRWIMNEEQLQSNGFPRPHPDGEKGKAKIYTQNDKQIPPKGRLRTCCRCKKEYMVDKRGFPAVKEDCNYHPNRKYRFRGEVKYQCCSQDENSEGCAMAPTHVFEYVDYDNLRGFVRTMPKDAWDPDNHDYGVFSLDCEMCYTTHGLDLTRITVIDSSCKTVYETFIKPLHPIIDYNTRYSGITEEQMADVTTTLLEVQATLLSMFSSKTILIGHSLESDFKALKLIHDTVVDTSVLFPHKMGPPYKRALRNLSSEHLKKIIQNSVDGHDSAEDATVCMELILWKLKEELKLR